MKRIPHMSLQKMQSVCNILIVNYLVISCDIADLLEENGLAILASIDTEKLQA